MTPQSEAHLLPALRQKREKKRAYHRAYMRRWRLKRRETHPRPPRQPRARTVQTPAMRARDWNQYYHAHRERILANKRQRYQAHKALAAGRARNASRDISNT